MIKVIVAHRQRALRRHKFTPPIISVGSAVGTCTAATTVVAVSAATSAQVGTSSGIATCAAIGALTSAQLGTAAGTSSAPAIGGSTVSAVGTCGATTTAVALGAAAPVAFVSGADDAGGSTFTATTSTDLEAGNLGVIIIGLVNSAGTTRSISSVSDGTNSYTKAQANSFTSGSFYDLEVWYAPNAAHVASGSTVTVTYSAADVHNSTSVVGVQIPAALAASPYDTAGAGATGGSNSPSVTTGTLGQSAEVVLGCNLISLNATYTEDPGFINLFNVFSGGTGNQFLSVGYKLVSSTSAVTHNPSLSGVRNFVEVAAPFKEFIGAATGTCAGTSTVSGISAATSTQVGTSTGVTTVIAIDLALVNSVGTSAATTTAAAISSATSKQVGTSAGTATANAVGAGGGAGQANAAGTATVIAISSATSPQVGTATGTANALAVGIGGSITTAFSAGNATAPAIGAAKWAGVGNAPGTSNVIAFSNQTPSNQPQYPPTPTLGAPGWAEEWGGFRHDPGWLDRRLAAQRKGLTSEEFERAEKTRSDRIAAERNAKLAADREAKAYAKHLEKLRRKFRNAKRIEPDGIFNQGKAVSGKVDITGPVALAELLRQNDITAKARQAQDDDDEEALERLLAA